MYFQPTSIGTKKTQQTHKKPEPANQTKPQIKLCWHENLFSGTRIKKKTALAKHNTASHMTAAHPASPITAGNRGDFGEKLSREARCNLPRPGSPRPTPSAPQPQAGPRPLPERVSSRGVSSREGPPAQRLPAPAPRGTRPARASTPTRGEHVLEGNTGRRRRGSTVPLSPSPPRGQGGWRRSLNLRAPDWLMSFPQLRASPTHWLFADRYLHCASWLAVAAPAVAL